MLVGIDGCPAGWICAVESDAGITVRVAPTLLSLAADLPPSAVIAIDMPIGLPARTGIGGRAPERMVRPLLGKRQSSVFSIPSRCAVYAGVSPRHGEDERYRRACELARATSDGGKAVAKQGFHIFPKIVEVDRFVRRSPGWRGRVFEVHPEVAFWAMNGDAPLSEPKKIKGAVNPAGIAQRRALLAQAGIPPDAVPGRAPRGAALDDMIDAFAALAVARCLAEGSARSFPDPPETDGLGVPVAIWTGKRVDG